MNPIFKPVLLTLSGISIFATASAQTITLEQAMADPDWIGRAPQQPYWSDDSDSVYYRQKRAGSQLSDLYQLDSDGDNLQQINAAKLATIDIANGEYSNNRRLKTYVRAGDIFVKNLRSGSVTQLTRTAVNETSPRFTADDSSVFFVREGNVFIRDLESGLETQAAELLSEKSPRQQLAEEDSDYLESQQTRLFSIIRLHRERELALREYREQMQRQDPSQTLLPFYLGEDEEVLSMALSPKKRWISIVVRNESEREEGRAGSMPNYVTASGYIENQELRARVGTTEFANQRVILLDLTGHQQAELDLSGLPGLKDQHLQTQLNLEVEATGDEEDRKEETRNLRIQGLRWSNDGERLLFHVITRDNKDRWLITLTASALDLIASEDSEFSTPVSVESDAINIVHHNHDPAWVNRRNITAKWLPDSEELIFVSEADGYLHLYHSNGEDVTQLTQGSFEVYEPKLSKDGETVYFRGNVGHPTVYEIYRVDINDQELTQLTELGGMNRFVLSPDENRLLITHSEALVPPELYIQRARPGASAVKITNTVSNEFKAIDWAQPEFIEVRSNFVENPIHSRVYTPQDESRNRPAVVFIHGAGYLQNAHQGWSSYFREFMFHSFLVQQGYVVLDMDYRASQGYGRDWRTAIYQQMGTPEVQDLANGVDWLVAFRNVDRARVCTYGGSYGGFLTLMSLFKKPDLFACGAALRPVTDWATYNHGYTSDILNIPDLDPEAFERSSPIEFADGLEKPLLIAHGMQDDNVFFQDSVRLVQRLIELEKENFEMAIYPTEPHGFREPSSWLDEYRRIYKLIDQTIGNTAR